MANQSWTSADRELGVIVAACRWHKAPDYLDGIQQAVAAPLNWPRLAALVQRHRVTGIVHGALYRAGGQSALLEQSGIAERARAAASKSLRLAAETVRLQGQFDAAKLPALIIKGAPLGVLAYGDGSIKEYWDIDLLTTRASVVAARRLLLELGYTPSQPASLDDAQLDRFADFAKEALFVNRHGQTVELHWRLTDSPALLRGIAPFANCRSVAVAQGSVRTLDDALQLAYLACHGQTHGWSRLKWIADLNGFLAMMPTARREELIDRASEFGARRFVDSAILLCHDLFRLDIEPKRLHQLTRHAVMRRVLTVNRRAIAAPVGGSDLPAYSTTAGAILAATFACAPDWRARAEIFGSYWKRPTEHALRPPGIAIGYSLRRSIGLLIRVPSRILQDRAAYRRAQAQVNSIKP